jgi:ubiquinone/menaquinone biosynthesis C-methylase UbiE
MKNEIGNHGERFVPYDSNQIFTEHMHRYYFAKQFVKGLKVLDVACGEGYGSFILAEDAVFVTGVDISNDAIEHASKKYVKNNLNFIQGKAQDIQVESNSFDVVISFETIEHHDQHYEMISEIKRVLSPNGILIISSPDKKYYSELKKYKNPFHIKELYKSEFSALISSNFQYCYNFNQGISIGSFIVRDKSINDNILSFTTGSIEKTTTICDELSYPEYNLIISSNHPIESNLLYKNYYFECHPMLMHYKKKEKELQLILNSKSFLFYNWLISPLSKLKSFFSFKRV